MALLIDQCLPPFKDVCNRQIIQSVTNEKP